MIWHTECQIANGNMLSGAGKRDVRTTLHSVGFEKFSYGEFVKYNIFSGIDRTEKLENVTC